MIFAVKMEFWVHLIDVNVWSFLCSCTWC